MTGRRHGSSSGGTVALGDVDERHQYGVTTWAVWLVLLGGPLLVAIVRLAQLWSSRPDCSA